MARRRFFVDQVRNGEAELTGEEAEHVARVLRAEVGHRYELSDNSEAFLAEVTLSTKRSVKFKILDRLVTAPPPARIALLTALFKFDHLEWTIEKATELGVEQIIPFRSERTEKGLELAARKRVERWRRIAKEASQQSRRTVMPEIADPLTFREALEFACDFKLYLEEEQGSPALIDTLPTDWAGLIGIAVGPEGGWADHERGSLRAAGFKPVSLGPMILRAETAATAALAVVMQKAMSSI